MREHTGPSGTWTYDPDTEGCVFCGVWNPFRICDPCSARQHDKREAEKLPYYRTEGW